MPRVLDGVKPGDWLCIVTDGVQQQLERVTRTSTLIVETENHKFTRYSRGWPKHKPSVRVYRAKARKKAHSDLRRRLELAGI